MEGALNEEPRPGAARKLTGKDDDEAVVRLCARGLCDRKGELTDFRHPLTRDVAYVELESNYGHDAFLVDVTGQTDLVRGFLASTLERVG